MLRQELTYVDDFGKRYADYDKAKKWEKRIDLFKEMLNTCYFYQFSDPSTDISPDISIPLKDRVQTLNAEICYVDKVYAKEKCFKAWNKVVKRYHLDLPILGNADLRYVKDFITNDSKIPQWYAEN